MSQVSDSLREAKEVNGEDWGVNIKGIPINVYITHDNGFMRDVLRDPREKVFQDRDVITWGDID